MLAGKNRRFKLVIWLIISVLVILLLVFGIIFSKNAVMPSSESKLAKTYVSPKPISVTSNILFLGNTFWGRYINDWSMASDLKYAYPFSKLGEFDRDSYDAWISGLECPLASGVDMTSSEQEENLQFNCSPDYLAEASKWFTAFTLANNHTDNQGVGGFEETKQQLDKNGIQYFGHYDYQNVDDVCEVISLPAKVLMDNDATISGRLPIALCGYHGVFGIPPDEAIAEIKKYGSFMPVIAMPHMGAEYKSEPDEIKSIFYRKLIDAGADMVIGDHPHWIQTTESYDGHLIVYSMGNFMFDQQGSAELTRSAAIRMFLNIENQEPDLLEKWLILGESCFQFKDNCLAKVISQNFKKLNITYKFGVIGTNDADKITKPATIEQQNSILDRLNWRNTMNNLQAPYSSL